MLAARKVRRRLWGFDPGRASAMHALHLPPSLPLRAASRLLRALRCLMFIGLGALGGGACSAQTVTIVRQDIETPLVNISEAVAREAFRRAGLTLVLRRASMAQSIELANAGEVDGELHRIADVVKQYPNLVVVPTPINTVDVGIYGAREDFARKSRAELRKETVVIQRGIFALQKATQGMAVTDTQTPSSAFDMLLNGRVDAAVLPVINTEYNLVDLGVKGIVRWPYLWASEPLHLLLHKRNANLVPRIEGALAAMQREGLIRRYYSDVLRARGIVELKPEPAGPGDPSRRH